MLSNAAYLSAWTDGWVELPFDEEQFLTYLDALREKENMKKTVAEEYDSSSTYRDRWQVQW
jgi:hypothetical protein